MALTLPSLSSLKSPFSGLSSATSPVANSTAMFSGNMAAPIVPKATPVPATTYNSQNMPLMTPQVSSQTPAVKAPVVAPKVTTSPVPVVPSAKVTPSGMVANGATGGVMQPMTQTPPVAPPPAAPVVNSSPAPEVPQAPSYNSPAYEAAMKAYTANIAPTAEEEQVAKDQAALETSLRTAYTNTEGQAIPLDFITGQKRRLQESATDLSQPLIAKAALLQARRTAALDASKFALEQEGKKIENYQSENKPVAVSAGSELINPVTGKKIASVAKTTTAEANQDPARVLSIDEAKTLGVPYGTTMGDAVKAGKVPGQADAGKDSTAGTMNIIDQLLSSDTNAISGVPSLSAFLPGTDAQKTKNLYDQLKGMLSLENRTQLKGSGAISDFESKTLEKAASSLGRNLSDKDFKSTLNDLKVDLTIGKMMKDGIPNDVIEQVVGKKIPFNTVGNTSVSIPKTSRLSFVNNNPGNLRFAGQDGAEEGEGGFAKFATAEAGLSALQNQVQLDAKRGHTLESFVYKYAPPSENDTTKYLSQIASATSSQPDTPLAQIDIKKLVAAIAKKESGTKIA